MHMYTLHSHSCSLEMSSRYFFQSATQLNSRVECHLPHVLSLINCPLFEGYPYHHYINVPMNEVLKWKIWLQNISFFLASLSQLFSVSREDVRQPRGNALYTTQSTLPILNGCIEHVKLKISELLADVVTTNPVRRNCHPSNQETGSRHVYLKLWHVKQK